MANSLRVCFVWCVRERWREGERERERERERDGEKDYFFMFYKMCFFQLRKLSCKMTFLYVSYWSVEEHKAVYAGRSDSLLSLNNNGHWQRSKRIVKYLTGYRH